VVSQPCAACPDVLDDSRRRHGARAEPIVSVMAESPMSGLASSGRNPESRPVNLGAGAVNQASPRPLTRIPTSVPLRAMVVTMVESGIRLRVEHRLATRHDAVQDEVAGPIDEGDRPDGFVGGLGHGHQVRGRRGSAGNYWPCSGCASRRHLDRLGTMFLISIPPDRWMAP